MSSDEVKRPGSWDEMFPGRFLKAGLFKDRPVTLTITDVTLEAMPTDKGPDQTRGILSFKQTPMQLAINKTNGVCLRAMFGAKPADWHGKRVTFVPEKDKFGKETVDAIRIQGSPDIAEPVSVEIRMPRKKPKTRKLTVTGKAAPTAPDPDTTEDKTEEPPYDFNNQQEEAGQ